MASKKDTYYFSHDANALSDPKILAMRCDYGLEGYGLYWAIIEMLRNEATYKLPLNKNTYRAIKIQTGTTIDVEKYVNDCIKEYGNNETENGLFNTDGKSFWSASLLRRMEQYETLKEKRSQAGKKAMQNRWGKQNDNKVITNKTKKKIRGVLNNNDVITKLSKKNNKVITSVIKKGSRLIAKNNKLNKIKSNQIKLNKIKLKEMKSIYPSNHNYTENKKLDEMMDEMDKMEFQRIISNCNLLRLNPQLCLEITEIIKELYISPDTREKIDGISERNVMYALKQFAVANTRTQIQIPKQYFKKCILSAMQQTELSSQYDMDTLYQMEGD